MTLCCPLSSLNNGNVMVNINGSDVQERNSQISYAWYFYEETCRFVVDDKNSKRGIADIVFTTGNETTKAKIFALIKG